MSQNKIILQPSDKIAELANQAIPFLSEISKILRENNFHDFELNVGDKDSFFWSGGLDNRVSPNQQELENQLFNILNNEYPQKVLSFMGMIYNPNRQLAQALAKMVSTSRAKDRREITGQLIALLKAFQLGS